MAGYETSKFSKHNDYMTPKSAWENIQHVIPKDKLLWECFYGDGKSGKNLEELGFDVIHKDIDIFKDKTLQIIIPKRRIQFIKIEDGQYVDTGNRCNFDCLYFCYKMNLEKDIIWLD